MLGMRKGGKRLLIIPPACAAGSEGVIGWMPSMDSVLVFEVEIRRVSKITLCCVDESSLLVKQNESICLKTRF